MHCRIPTAGKQRDENIDKEEHEIPKWALLIDFWFELVEVYSMSVMIHDISKLFAFLMTLFRLESRNDLAMMAFLYIRRIENELLKLRSSKKIRLFVAE